LGRVSNLDPNHHHFGEYNALKSRVNNSRLNLLKDKSITKVGEP
jgi:hypothetical protein